MGNGYNQHQNLLQQKNIYMPRLCSRTLIKDVTIPKYEKHSSSSSSDDPLSPKISCMGQVKRNNKIIGFPPPHKFIFPSTKPAASTPLKYSKLKRFFSGKNLAASTTAASAAITTASCRRREAIMNGGASGHRPDLGNESSVSINVVDLDPPLPVIKRAQKSDDKDSLWKRRSGGVALKGLQLQQDHLPPRHQFEPTTV